MTAVVNVLNQKECVKIYGKDIPPGMICAGMPDDFLYDVCRGDTGGPLICNNTLIAVTSSRVGCGQNNTPSVYTDLWHLIHWIERNPGRENVSNYRIVILGLSCTILFVVSMEFLKSMDICY